MVDEYDKKKHSFLTEIHDIGHKFAKRIVDALHNEGVDHTDEGAVGEYLKNNLEDTKFHQSGGHDGRIKNALARKYGIQRSEEPQPQPEEPEPQPQPQPEPERRKSLPKPSLPGLKVLMFIGLCAVLLLLAYRFFGFLGSNLFYIIGILGLFGILYILGRLIRNMDATFKYLILILVTLLVPVVSYSFGYTPVLWMSLAVGIITALVFYFSSFGFNFEGVGGRIIMILIFFVVLVVAVVLLNQLAKQAGFDTPFGAEEQATVEESLKGFRPFYNQMLMIFRGEYDPNARWDSREVKESYVVPKDAGVVFKNIRPSRSFFYSPNSKVPIRPDDLEITGDVTIVSLFEEGTGVSKTTPVEIDVDIPNCEDSITAKFYKVLSGESPIGIGKEEWCDEPWVCSVSGAENVVKDGKTIQNKFEIERVYNQFFTCQHPGLNVDEDTDLRAKVVWRYGTEAVSGKQIFVADSGVMRRVEDLRKHYNIPKASFDAWSISDGNIDFALGFDQRVEFLEARGPEDALKEICEEQGDGYTYTASTKPYNIEDGSCSPSEPTGKKPLSRSYFLGVSITNDGVGKVVKINDLTITIPKSPDIWFILDQDSDSYKVNDSGDVLGGESLDFELVYSETQQIQNGVEIQTFRLKPLSVEIEPGDAQPFYLPLSIDSDYLQGSAYQSFFAKAYISYEYEQEKPTVLNVDITPFGRTEEE